ncbi:hypothetical protein EVJ58_g265 [Rhodofomes roseus]|uniref:Uncharacterized protein n=1 Tax=Rhodofomes roseus TaxID=34475 RepID=A0A4Y9Z6P3_9APHY|nr:hypothetical protein EVJ58_g265 [Rhodofomes roseus]
MCSAATSGTVTDTGLANASNPGAANLEPEPELDNNSVCSWDGGLNEGARNAVHSSDAGATELGYEGDSSELEDEEVEEMTDQELVTSLQRDMAREVAISRQLTPYNEIVSQQKSAMAWKKAESRLRGPHYSGNLSRTARRQEKQKRDKESENERLRTMHRASMFWQFFAKADISTVATPAKSHRLGGSLMHDPQGPMVPTSSNMQNCMSGPPVQNPANINDSDVGFTGYLSDMSDAALLDDDNVDAVDAWYDDDLLDEPSPESRRMSPPISVSPPNGNSNIAQPGPLLSTPQAVPVSPSLRPPAVPFIPIEIPSAPPLKRHKLDVPLLAQHEERLASLCKMRVTALRDIKWLLSSKRDHFTGGMNGLQSYRARAIQACLHAMIHNEMGMKTASEAAAVGNMFAKGWGGRQVRRWTHQWVKERVLPESKHGNHAKMFSLFSDPSVRAELRAYMRSEKWAMNPSKLQQFVSKEMPSKEANAYARRITVEEIPRGLKKYLEEILLPRLHLRKPAGRGFSLSTMHCVMLREGFTFSMHKKVLYYDGHERPDVVHDRQHRFIPEIQLLRSCMVQYVVGDVTHKVEVNNLEQDAGPRLVLVAHDESTAQANDGQKWSWILDGEQPIKKKGQGRGIHQSDFICLTYGWLASASQTMEYGKNYEGYWNGELFIKQKSLVQETIEAAGHLCIFLPKFHCEINFIEYFWGAVKKYLHDCCDCTFDMLKENMPKALASVSVELIRKWEHRAWRFIDAYGGGLDAKQAQARVQEFSSRKYKSHRRIPERLAAQMDA